MANLKTVKLVKITSSYINNETGKLESSESLTSEQKLLSVFNGSHLYVEQHTCLATFTAKTYAKLNQDVDIWMAENNDYDVHCILIK